MSGRAFTKDRMFSNRNIYDPPKENDDLREKFDLWTDLIIEYLSRQITHSADRVMAFAGVARLFATTHTLTYLAGTFLE